MRKKLILEDGSVFAGEGFGAEDEVFAELVFNTSMAGYQEIISDPSYTGQAVVMTYPLIGNYGMCADDYESASPSVSGLVVREYCGEPSNFRSEKALAEVMKDYHISGISGVDTRKITRMIRTSGSLKAAIVSEDKETGETLEMLRKWQYRTDQVQQVSTDHIYAYTGGEDLARWHVVAIDCGMKKSILKELADHGCRVSVVPWNTSAEVILRMNPDGVFISNGPGDPENVPETIETVKKLIGNVPIFGICLGHQIISLAYGARVYKLKFGHHGGNHPVKNELTGKVEVTSQNHSYAVDRRSLLSNGLLETHINLLDGTVEGVHSLQDHVMGIQYHPESAPGPNDSGHLFSEFTDMMQAAEEGR